MTYGSDYILYTYFIEVLSILSFGIGAIIYYER